MKLEGVPEGYEAVRLGKANQGECFVTIDGNVCVAECDHEAPRLIVRKVEPIATWKHGVFADGWISEDKHGTLEFYYMSPPSCDVGVGGWLSGHDGGFVCSLNNILQPSVFKFRDDLPWTERCVQVGPSVENA